MLCHLPDGTRAAHASVRLIAALILGALLVAPVAEAGWTWRRDTGWYHGDVPTMPTAREQYEQGIEFFEAGEFRLARESFRRLAKKFREDELVPEGRFLAADCSYQLGDYGRAYKEYEAVIEDYPNTEQLMTIVARELEMGRAFLEGRKRGIAGVRLIPSRAKGIAVLRSVIAHAALSDEGEAAQLEIADHRFRGQDYEEASVEYEAFLDTYLTSERREWAAYRRAICDVKRIRGYAYDTRPMKDAERTLSSYLALYQTGEHVDECAAHLREIRDMRAQRLFVAAEHYRTNNKDEAAIRCYRQVVSTYPSGEWGGRARAALRDLVPEDRLEPDEG